MVGGPAHVKLPGKCWACGQPNNHTAAALHLVPRGRPQASIVLGV